jgi:NAD(P)-dependent dehydrogenase (short-subunit alcohol dehydrogenase family)
MGPRRLVITGASRGIGRAVAQRFVAGGWSVANLSRTPSGLAGTTDIAADLAAPDWADAVRDPLLAALDGAETVCLIHNCALNIPAAVDAVAADDFRRVLEVGLVAPSILNRLLLERMGPGSSVLYVGSTLSQRATAGMAAYVSLKHAVVGLMRATAQDLKGRGVHTACVCPGFTETEMLRGYGGEMLARLAALTTQNRLIAPEEIAEVLWFAAASPVVNGAVLGADLGFVEP